MEKLTKERVWEAMQKQGYSEEQIADYERSVWFQGVEDTLRYVLGDLCDDNELRERASQVPQPPFERPFRLQHYLKLS
jgi:hypothetical protein